ncbi:glycosyltransferase family 4 protein [Breoghania sp. JC706]|uniref:glycosyltransferase family 4 protein n=1 Tax=Breoghania sp. JC706 TaxID=3117732 RepID=UPI00300BF815
MTGARLVFAYPGALDTPSGGYEYDRRIMAGLERRGWSLMPLSLGVGFPFAATEVCERALAQLSGLPQAVPVVIDGLALGVLPAAAATLGAGRPLIGLVHHPLALESGLSRETAEGLRTSERHALAGCRGVIVPSPATARVLTADYGVAPAQIVVVRPGTHGTGGSGPAPDRRQRTSDDPIRLLAVGSLVPRKGHEILLDALSTMADMPFHLDIAGSPDFDPDCAARIREKARSPALAGRVTLHGVVGREALDALYGQADLFVLATRYEGYGMVFAEAVAHGVPVLATGDGAVAETVPEGAGRVFPAADAAGFRKALRQLLTDAAMREELAAGARRAAARLPDWDTAADEFAAAVARFTQPREKTR